MYIPRLMRETDVARIRAIVHEFPFATLVTTEPSLAVTHIPLTLDVTEPTDRLATLHGHLAAANPHADALAAEPRALAIFQGPHGYISPRTYVNPNNVPTWNYVAVHIHGRIRLVVDPMGAATSMRNQVARFEGDRWRPDPAYLTKLLPQVRVFRLEVTDIEAKLKLSQNRVPEDRDAATAALAASDSPADRELARWMARDGRATS